MFFSVYDKKYSGKSTLKIANVGKLKLLFECPHGSGVTIMAIDLCVQVIFGFTFNAFIVFID